MARSRQPVADEGGNGTPALATGAVVGAGFAGHEQDDFEFLRNRLFERTVEPGIGARQVGVVQVDADVGNKAAALDSAVPVAVEVILPGTGRWRALST